MPFSDFFVDCINKVTRKVPTTSIIALYLNIVYLVNNKKMYHAYLKKIKKNMYLLKVILSIF